MTDATTDPLPFPSSSDLASDDPLTAILRQGARRLLSQAVEAEVEQWIAEHAHLLDERGHRQVVRNGPAQPRRVVTGLGPVKVKIPRVHDRRDEPERERFTSNIPPRGHTDRHENLARPRALRRFRVRLRRHL